MAETGRSKPSEQQEPQARFACDVDRRLRTVDANACKKVKARRAGVPSTRSAQARNTAQAKRRAVRNVKMHSRPDRWPLEAAKRLEARAHAVRRQRPRSGWRREDTPKRRPQRRNTAPPKARAVRSAGTLGRRRRHSAKTSGRADSLANQRFANEQKFPLPLSNSREV